MAKKDEIVGLEAETAATRVNATRNDDGSYTFGVNRAAERYDTGTGLLFSEARVSRADIETALDNADKAHKNRVVDDGLRPRIDPSDHRADSSPRSEDRPPVLISSATSPQPTNPVPSDEAQAADLPRDAAGIADIPANKVTKAQPNLATPPSGVKRGSTSSRRAPAKAKATA